MSIKVKGDSHSPTINAIAFLYVAIFFAVVHEDSFKNWIVTCDLLCVVFPYVSIARCVWFT